MRELVGDQTKEWSAMVYGLMTEEHELLKCHILQQSELLKKLLEESQNLQLKDLEFRQERSRTFPCQLFFLFTISHVNAKRIGL